MKKTLLTIAIVGGFVAVPVSASAASTWGPSTTAGNAWGGSSTSAPRPPNCWAVMATTVHKGKVVKVVKSTCFSNS